MTSEVPSYAPIGSPSDRAQGPTIDVFIQVRLASSRLPGKALLPLGREPCLGQVIQRVKGSRTARRIVVCTSTQPEDSALIGLADDYGVDGFQGDVDDCLERFLACAYHYGTDIIVRICGDSPLVSAEVIDGVVQQLLSEQLDYVYCRKLPVGAYVEAFTYAALERAWLAAMDSSLSDDLTYFLQREEIARSGEHLPADELMQTGLVLALNRPEDLFVLQRIFEDLEPLGSHVTLIEAIAYCDQHPEVVSMNQAYHPVPTSCDVRLDVGHLPNRPPDLPWYRGLGLHSQGIQL